MEPARINVNDFVSLDRRVIMLLQKRDLRLIVDGEIYVSQLLEPDEDDDTYFLYFNLYGFRDQYPQPPVKQQLEDLFFEAGDLGYRQLKLKTDGRFYLDPLPPEPSEFTDPEIIVEYFRTGDGHIGFNNYVKDALFNAHIDLMFRKGIRYWRDHLLNKNLHECASTTANKFDNVDINTIYEELLSIEKNRIYL
jgi:hypothetical protein